MMPLGTLRKPGAMPVPGKAMAMLLEKFKQASQHAQAEVLSQYYENTIDALTRGSSQPLQDIDLLALDLETTGLNPEVDDILSIGTVRMRVGRIQYGSRRRWLLKPVAKLRADSISIHGITHNDVEQAPDLAEILPDFLQELSGRIAVVHCAAVEETFLDIAIRYRLGEGLVFPAIDTMGLARHFGNQNKGGWLARLRPAKTTPSLRLADQRTLYGLPFYPPHEAVTDALATGELLMAMTQHHQLQSTPLTDLVGLR